jgi:transposase
VERDDHRWVVETSGSGVAACPDCGAVSSARHSKYWRHLKDLPLQGSAVRIQLGVGRWRCRNAVCRQRIFCERLPKVTAKFACETHRFSEAVHLVGYALGGRPGERLGGREGE